MSLLLGSQFSLIPGPWKADVVLPFYEAVADLEEASSLQVRSSTLGSYTLNPEPPRQVFSRAIIARAEMLRPFDASRWPPTLQTTACDLWYK